MNKPKKGPDDDPFKLLFDTNTFSSIELYPIDVSARIWAFQVMVNHVSNVSNVLTAKQKEKIVAKAQHDISEIDTFFPLPAGPALKKNAIQHLQSMIQPLEKSMRRKP